MAPVAHFYVTSMFSTHRNQLVYTILKLVGYTTQHILKAEPNQTEVKQTKLNRHSIAQA